MQSQIFGSRVSTLNTYPTHIVFNSASETLLVGGFTQDYLLMKKNNPGSGNFSYNYLSFYEKKPNVTFNNKWNKNYDYNGGYTKSGYFDTLAMSNNSKVIMAMDVESDFLIFVDATNGELIFKIGVEGTGNLNINGGVLLHQNSSNTYAAYYVMRKAPYYKIACLNINFTANPASIVTNWTLVSIQNQT